MSKSKKILEVALSLFGDNGQNWIRGAARMTEGGVLKVCAAGAMHEAACREFGITIDSRDLQSRQMTSEELKQMEEANNLVKAVFCKMFNLGYSTDIATANDLYAKGYADIEKAFKAAIAVADLAPTLKQKAEMEAEASRSASKQFEELEGKRIQQEVAELKKKTQELYEEIVKKQDELTLKRREFASKQKRPVQEKIAATALAMVNGQ